jgi:CRP-like cAMP-binding protein
VFRRGSLIFIEGETSTEMYILKNGRVRILKQEGQSTVELAALGPGSVLGELSLLDGQPRSETAQVVEDVTAAVVDKELFTRTMSAIPPWLSAVIRELVKRLRNTMKKTRDDVVQKSIAGVIRVVTYLCESEGFDSGGGRAVWLGRANELIYATVGVGAVEAEHAFLHLILKDMLLIKKNELGREYVVLKDLDALLLYMNYLRAKQRSGSLVGEELSEKAVDLLTAIISAGEKSGEKTGPGLVSLGQSQLERELDRTAKGRLLDAGALDELVRARVVAVPQEAVPAKLDSYTRKTIVFNMDTLRRLRVLAQWLPVFKEEVLF